MSPNTYHDTVSGLSTDKVLMQASRQMSLHSCYGTVFRTRGSVAKHVADGSLRIQAAVVLRHEGAHAHVLGRLHVLVDKHQALGTTASGFSKQDRRLDARSLATKQQPLTSNLG